MFPFRRQEFSGQPRVELEDRLGEGAEGLVLTVTAVPGRTTEVYGHRGLRYVREEVGHLLQNAVVMCSALNLAIGFELLNLDLPINRGEYEVLRITPGPAVVASDPPLPLRLTGVEEAMYSRRSVRSYSGAPLKLYEVSAILELSLREEGGLRPYPPLGGYRVNTFLVVRNVEGMDLGVYAYSPQDNSLERVRFGDVSKRLWRSCLSQNWVLEAPLNVVFTSRNPGPLADVEAGMAGQNIYLVATGLGLGTVAIGAFYDEEVAEALGVDEAPLYVLPVGRPA